ncbi:hypothetical protein LCGC14_0548470, partial [marine sediment metagenome]
MLRRHPRGGGRDDGQHNRQRLEGENPGHGR